MAIPRENHAASLLIDGRVLVTGGKAGPGPVATHASAELYDPAGGAWSTTLPMSTPRQLHTSTRLADGRVLVAGGRDAAGASVATAELYDPVGETWTPTGSMATPRARHSAVLLGDGRVVVAGGLDDTAVGPGQVVLKSSEIYDPSSGTWTPAESMAVNRYGFVLLSLPDGRLLALGGASSAGDFVFAASTEIFSPSSGHWSRAHDMTEGRGFFDAVVLSDGRILATAGEVHEGSLIGAVQTDSTEVRTGAKRWVASGSLAARRWFHHVALTSDGSALVVGGGSFENVGHGISIQMEQRETHASAEFYDAATGSWSPAGNMLEARIFFTLTRLSDGRLLAAGGRGSAGVGLTSSEIYP